MTKTRRQMAEYIKQVDAVCEVVDARIPQVSRNPDMDEIAAGKPRMMILNRIDLADPNMTAGWAKHFREQGPSSTMSASVFCWRAPAPSRTIFWTLRHSAAS